MIDLTTPYAEILKKPADTQEEIICIRQGSLEPIYDSYIRHYNPSITVRYTDVYGYLNETSSAPAVAILNLRELAPVLWERLYTLSETDIRNHIENVQQLLFQLITKMENISSLPIFFLLCEESPVFKQLNTYSTSDIIT